MNEKEKERMIEMEKSIEVLSKTAMYLDKRLEDEKAARKELLESEKEARKEQLEAEKAARKEQIDKMTEIIEKSDKNTEKFIQAEKDKTEKLLANDRRWMFGLIVTIAAGIILNAIHMFFF